MKEKFVYETKSMVIANQIFGSINHPTPEHMCIKLVAGSSIYLSRVSYFTRYAHQPIESCNRLRETEQRESKPTYIANIVNSI